MSHPIDALERAIAQGFWWKSARREFGPSAVVTRAAAEDRAALSKLQSRDLRSIRADVVALYVEVDDRDRQARLNFDEQLRQHGRL